MEKKYIFKLRRGTKDDATDRDDWAEYEAQEDHLKPLEGELVLEHDNGIPRLKIGDGASEFSALPYMSIDSFILPKQAFVNLSTEWEAEDNRYYQEVEIQNATVTPKSKIDLQPDSAQLYVFHEKDLAFVAENNNGVVRVYCVGQVPQNSYQIPVTVTEVITDATIIIGDTTATPNPQPDWNQTDSTKADYIKNKPDIQKYVDDNKGTKLYLHRIVCPGHGETLLIVNRYGSPYTDIEDLAIVFDDPLFGDNEHIAVAAYFMEGSKKIVILRAENADGILNFAYIDGSLNTITQGSIDGLTEYEPEEL